MAGIMLTVFKSAVASSMFSGISSALKATRTTSVLSEPQRKYMFRFSLKLHSHIDYQHRLSPVSLFDELQQVPRVGSGDVQRVHDVKVVLRTYTRLCSTCAATLTVKKKKKD